MTEKKGASGSPKMNEVVELDTSRRSVLRSLAVAGTGVAGLKTGIENVTGKSAEGVPIVHTRDANDNPVKVRMVPKERRRRIQFFDNLSASSFIEKHPYVDRMSLKQQSDDETDLSIHLHLEKNTFDVRKKLPNRLGRMPVTFEEDDSVIKEQGDCNAPNPNDGARRCQKFSELKGGIQIGSEGSSSFGTLTLVAWNSDGTSKMAITAHHVMENKSDKMHQPANSCSSSEHVADETVQDSSHDTWAGDMSWLSTGTIGATVDAIPDITGYWTYAGIADYTTTNSIYCFMAGAESFKHEGYANSVSKDDWVEHQVNYGDNNGESGDSGSPYVDQDGKLVSMYNAVRCAGGDLWDVGVAGDYVLSTTNTSLSS